MTKRNASPQGSEPGNGGFTIRVKAEAYSALVKNGLVLARDQAVRLLTRRKPLSDRQSVAAFEAETDRVEKIFDAERAYSALRAIGVQAVCWGDMAPHRVVSDEEIIDVMKASGRSGYAHATGALDDRWKRVLATGPFDGELVVYAVAHDSRCNMRL